MSPSSSQGPSGDARCCDRPLAQGFVVSMHIDGACRGNPGPGGIGVVISSSDLVLREISEAIGRCTNNVAEYTALIRGVEAALEMGTTHARAFSDSELVVRQINGAYKVKSAHLLSLFEQARCLIERLRFFELQHVSRADNARADRLADQAISAYLKRSQRKEPKQAG